MTSTIDEARLAARTAAEKQAEAVVILDVREQITITDYFVVCSGASERQVKTIAEEVENALKTVGRAPVRVEGGPGARWILIDYVDFVVHVFHDEERAFYRLETLWQDAPRVQLEAASEAV